MFSYVSLSFPEVPVGGFRAGNQWLFARKQPLVGCEQATSVRPGECPDPPGPPAEPPLGRFWGDNRGASPRIRHDTKAKPANPK